MTGASRPAFHFPAMTGASRPAFHFPAMTPVKALLQLKEAWGVWKNNSNANTACPPPHPPPLPLPPCAGSEGAAAAEGGVGRVGKQQQRHHGVLCMGWRLLQPQRARRRPVSLVALDAKKFVEVDPPATGSIPASITALATLQYLDLTFTSLEGPIPSLATLTGLTHLAIGLDGSRLTGTLDGLAWLSSLTNLRTL
ncbi:unnamed protein product, partial [Closterium sp. NIES-65]